MSSSPTDFVIMEDTMLKPFATLISCRDTIQSECPRGDTLEQCVQRCRENPLCSAGYYLEPTYENQSYCVPLNSALHQNMNLMLNYYKKETDPTKDLWKRAVLFFRPSVYPQVQNDITVIKEKDICRLSYTISNRTFYLQEDLSWDEKGIDSAMQILFINIFPQFYELADTISTYENIVLKIFSKPEIVTVVNGVFKKVPYLVQNSETHGSNLHVHINKDMNTQIDYPVLMLDSPFQIFVNDRTKYMGLTKNPPKRTVQLQSIDSSIAPKGYFMAHRVNIQPNIYKVAEILPARLTFLQNMITPSFSEGEVEQKKIIILSVCIACILIVILFIYFFF